MSKENEQLRALMRSPKKMMDYQLRRKMPEVRKPNSPLIRYLESIPMRERIELKHVRLSPKLGYNTGTSFQNAEMMLKWLKPRNWMSTSWPAESYRIKSFHEAITKELFNSAQDNK